ncbi:hypothetical protein CRE_04946 [Caenorhabditis remanei]|uniref:Uncharacterized protein n=1 Tax=Caenorhabditis remanei TaxID=31234 RepID=E3MN49_CAERE|nr:hypothetical protein CRE_04946 [Caenorhabditis remanei]
MFSSSANQPTSSGSSSAVASTNPPAQSSNSQVSLSMLHDVPSIPQLVLHGSITNFTIGTSNFNVAEKSEQTESEKTDFVQKIQELEQKLMEKHELMQKALESENKLKEDMRKLFERNEEQITENQILKNQNHQLKEDMKEQMKTNMELLTENQYLKTQNNQLKENMEELMKTNKELLTENRNLKSQNQQLKTETEMMRQRAQNIETARRNERAKMEEAKELNVKLEESVVARNQQIKILKDRNRYLINSLLRRMDELEQLQTQAIRRSARAQPGQ